MMTIRLALLRRWSAVIFVAIISACGTKHDKTSDVDNDKRRCLYTQGNGQDELCFTLIPFRQCDEFLRRHEKKLVTCGLSELENAFKALPHGSEVLWEDDPDSGFGYPSDAVIEKVQKLAGDHGISVVITPVLTEKLSRG